MEPVSSRSSEPPSKPTPPAAESPLSIRPLEPPSIFTYFDRVARFGSIRRAAESLHIASSALNRRILDLEHDFGTPLFERLPRGVRLTAAGEIYLAFVRRSLKEFQKLESEIEGLKRQRHGLVRIAAAESVTPSLLPEAISEFQSRHPHVAFHVTVDGPERLTNALVSDSVDLVLTHDPPERSAIEVLFSASHPLCALVVKAHPLATRSSVHLSECTDFPAALPDSTLAARGFLERALAASKAPLEVAFESNSIEALKTFARLGRAIAYSFQLGREPAHSGLVAIPLRDQHCREAHLYLAARRGRVLPVAAASFAEELADALRAHFQETSAEGSDAEPIDFAGSDEPFDEA